MYARVERQKSQGAPLLHSASKRRMHQTTDAGMESQMFRVKGVLKESREYHEKLIADVAKSDVGAGIILAAVYFEWCVRRSIVALGKSPIGDLNEKLHTENLNFEKLKSLWKQEVTVVRDGKVVSSLSDVFDLAKNKPAFGSLKLIWSDIDKARKRRNELVHGSSCAPLEKNGMKYVALLLEAAKKLDELCIDNTCSVFEIITEKIDRKTSKA